MHNDTATILVLIGRLFFATLNDLIRNTQTLVIGDALEDVMDYAESVEREDPVLMPPGGRWQRDLEAIEVIDGGLYVEWVPAEVDIAYYPSLTVKKLVYSDGDCLAIHPVGMSDDQVKAVLKDNDFQMPLPDPA